MGIRINQKAEKQQADTMEARSLAVGATFIDADAREQLLSMLDPDSDDDYEEPLEIFMRVPQTGGKKGGSSGSVNSIRLSDGDIKHFESDDLVIEVDLDVRIELV